MIHKILITGLIGCCMLGNIFKAAAEDLIWDDLNPAGMVKSFTIWKEVDIGVWEEIETVAEQRWKIVLPAGVHRLAVSAIGAGPSDVSSALSEPATITVLVVPGNVRVQK